MTTTTTIDQLYNEIAERLEVEQLVPDTHGGIQFDVGEDEVLVFEEGESTLLLVVPVAEIPPNTDFGSMLWLMRKNLYDSDLEPFRIAADESGNLILWGRLSIESITADSLLELMKELGAEAVNLRADLDLGEDEEREENDIRETPNESN